MLKGDRILCLSVMFMKVFANGQVKLMFSLQCLSNLLLFVFYCCVYETCCKWAGQVNVFSEMFLKFD